jgi:hypothetical protein
MTTDSNFETIKASAERLGGRIENMGANCRAWRFDLPNGDIVYLAADDGYVEGDPEAYEWGVSRWRGEEEIDRHDGFQLDDCLLYVSRWKQGAF